MTRRRQRPGGSSPGRPAPATAAATAPPAWLLWLCVLLLPAAVPALAEGALRLAGFGHDLEPLFIASPAQPGYRQPNPLAVRRFFSDPAAAPAVSIETTYFRDVKPANGLRIVVQGESSAAGFPYGLSASLAGMLQERLQRSFPSREVEVISTAMAAVTSYALVDFADEIIAARPDAVVIYVGHNEYLGILGVGSTLRMASSRGLTRTFLALRESRLLQLMQRAVSAVRPVAHVPAADPGESLMARVAGERQIESGSSLYGLGVAQFRANLTALLGRYRRAAIPVFVATLVSNEADQPPLGAGAPNAAAHAAYLRGTALAAEGRYAEARAAFIAARDLDVLRFRAPSEFNAVVRAVAAAEGATLVDVEQAFSRASEHGIIGRGLVLEHVHPNLDGYFLLAESCFQSLLAHGLAGPAEVTVPTAEARADAPVSDIDRWLGDYKTLRLKSNWPFRATPAEPVIPPPADLAQALAQEVYYQRLGWVEAHERLRASYREAQDVRHYAQLSGILADAFPFTAPLQFETAVALIGIGRPVDALRYARRGTAVDGGSVNGLLIEAHALALNGRLADARRVLERVLVLAPGNATATGVIAEIDARLAQRGDAAGPAGDGPRPGQR